jgi:hypothetical protein
VNTADACDREAAWLSTADDGLPTLPATAGGPFGLIQAYWPRTPGKRNAGQLYVLRRTIEEKRFANQRRMATHHLVLKLVWPLTSGSGNAEADQRGFDAAIDLVITRIGGFIGDKTHGGRFLSVAEGDHSGVTVHFDDPASTLPPGAEFRAEIMYSADDQDFTG